MFKMCQSKSSLASAVTASYWSVQELVVIGVFSAAVKISTLLVALVGGGPNPVGFLVKNLVFTTLFVVMLYRVRRPGTLTLFILINMLISMLLLGANVSLLPSMLGGALLAEFVVLAGGGMKRAWGPVLGVAVYDLTSKILSLGISWLFMRENPAMFMVVVPFVVIGYIGSVGGLFTGVRAVGELRHAGIIRN